MERPKIIFFSGCLQHTTYRRSGLTPLNISNAHSSGLPILTARVVDLKPKLWTQDLRSGALKLLRPLFLFFRGPSPRMRGDKLYYGAVMW